MPLVERSKRIDYLRGIGVAEPLVEMACGKPLHPEVEIAYRLTVDEIYRWSSSEWIQRIVLNGEWAPLWEKEARTFVAGRLDGHLEFAVVSYEDVYLYPIGSSNQSMMAYIVAELTWAGALAFDLDRETLVEIATLIGYKHLEEQERFAEHSFHESPYREWIASLVD